MKLMNHHTATSISVILLILRSRVGVALSVASATSSLHDVLPPLAQGSQRLYLCRHGETDWNIEGRIQGGGNDTPLNENGRLQARCLAAALHGVKLDVVASSHLDRADETADMIYRSQLHRRPRRIVSGKLGEMRFGADWEGVVWRERESAFQQVNDMINKDQNLEWPNGGESTQEVANRAKHAILHQVLDADTIHQACCVAHGRVNRILAEHLLQTDNLPKHANAGISVLDRCADGKWTLRVYNYCGHLLED